MVNVRSFCGKRTQHCEIASAANEEEKEKTETADIVMIGLPLSGWESDLKNENDDSLCACGLPKKVSCELEVFNVHNEDLFDDDDSNDETMVRLLLHLHQRKQRKENHTKRWNGIKSIWIQSQLSNQTKIKVLKYFCWNSLECWIDCLVIFWESVFRYCFFIGWRDK